MASASVCRRAMDGKFCLPAVVVAGSGWLSDRRSPSIAMFHDTNDGSRGPSAQDAMRFGRDTRITRSAEFLAVRKTGKRVTCGDVTVGWRQCDGDRASRVGLAVSRGAGGAVGRNRARRVLREAFRSAVREGTVPASLDVVMIVRRGRESSRELLSDAREALRITGKRVAH